MKKLVVKLFKNVLGVALALAILTAFAYTLAFIQDFCLKHPLSIIILGALAVKMIFDEIG